MLGTWLLEAETGRVVLVTQSGERRKVSAFDIWRSEFELQSHIDGIRVTAPSACCVDLHFSASSVDLCLVTYLAPDSSIRLGVQVGDSSAVLPAVPTQDQLVHDKTWFCLDETQLNDLKQQIDLVNVPLGVGLTAGQALALSTKFAIPSLRSADQIPIYVRHPAGDLNSLVNATLYAYQEAGVQRLVDLFEEGIGCLLADEMGLGKTLQVIALLAFAKPHGPSLVVCPASTLANWRNEISKFAPALRIHLHQGPKRVGSAQQLKHADVVITSYETLAQDVHFLKQLSWAVVAYDEAQYLKNPAAGRTRSASLLSSRCVVAVTGTPIENSLRDLWSIVNLIAPGYLPCLPEFEAQYPDDIGAASAAGLRVSPIVIRRTVAEVASSLPNRVDMPVPISMGSAQAAAYDEVLHSEASMLAKITALRTTAASIDTSIQSVKHQYLHELCSEAIANGKKVLVFVSFANVLDDIAASLRQIDPGVFVGTIDGRTNVEERQQIIDSFTEHLGGGVLVLNPRAAGVGLNIQAANYVIHFTPEWNPAIVDQASARAHRNGQKQTVFVYYLYYENSVEQVMIERLEVKRRLQEHGLEAAQEGPSGDDFARIVSMRPSGDHVG